LTGTLLEVAIAGARPPVEAIAALPNVADVQIFGDRAHVRMRGASPAEDAARLVAALAAAGFPNASVRRIPASLEDVFIDLISATKH
jgi:hypothetical protein